MQPVDLDRLQEQTGGDGKLAREVLALFVEDAPGQLEKLAEAKPEDRRAIAHRLRGAARAIGADDVARAAAAVERGEGDAATLAVAVEAVRQWIAAYLAKPE